MRRNASRSRARGGTSEDDDLLLALQRLADKLRASQPFYSEEDVAVIPFPGDSAGSSPSRSPSRPGEEDPNVKEDPLSLDGSTRQGKEEEGKRSQAVKSQSQTSNGTQSATPSAGAASSSSINLDQPLSVGLFLTAVNILEPKVIGKSRKATLDAVKLLKQAYALIWRDPQYIVDSAKSAAAAALLLPSSPATSRAASPGAMPEGRPSISPGKRGLGGAAAAQHASTRSRSPAPAFAPDRAQVALLDQAVQSLLVYANNSFFLSQYITSQETVLRVFCFVCWAARRFEDEAAAALAAEEEEEADGRNPCGGNSGPPTGGEGRDLEAELTHLESLWAVCGLAGRVVDFLRECYLTEFLLDACLPPAVCSSRYDGVSGALFAKKQRILMDMVTSRHGFAAMMQAVPLRGLAGIAAMSSFAETRLKARLLDKMTSEGLVDRLYEELTSACQGVLEAGKPTSAGSNAGGSSTNEQSKDGGGSKTRSSPTKRRQGRPSRASQSNTSASASQPDCTQTSSAGAAEKEDEDRRPSLTCLDPVERLGYCVDLLQLLTSPNLRPAAEADELARNPKTAASAVIQATEWATHEKAVQGVTSRLLWIICHTSGRRGHPRFSSLQATATECVLQIAAFSGLLYSMVISAVESLFKGRQRGRPVSGFSNGSAEGGSVGLLPSLLSSRGEKASVSRSPSRSPAPKAALSSQATRASSTSSTVAGAGAALDASLSDPCGLLPLIVSLLRHPVHASANAASIRRWFRWLADSLLPQAFEAPQLTNGRRSTAAWGRLRRDQQVHTSRKEPSAGRSPSKGRTAVDGRGGRPRAPVLARDLTRFEISSLSPYFSFAVRLVQETPWRDGAEPFLAKVGVLAYHVVLLNARRCNLCFGQASTCYDVVAPLLLPVGGVIPGDVVAPAVTPAKPLAEEEGPGKRGRRSTGESPRGGASAKKRKQTRADKASEAIPSESDSDEDGGKDRGSAEADFQLFIPSPSRSPVFYEAYSPGASEVTFIGDGSPSSRGSSPLSASPVGSPTRRLDVDGADTTATSLFGGSGTSDERDKDDGTSPQGSITRSWRHSLKMLISTIGGGPEEAELKRD